MGDPKGFLKITRVNSQYRPVCQRLKDYNEVVKLRPVVAAKDQASRCMDCGTPFCHWSCPVGNYIPEWNDLMFHGKWEEAWQLLQKTNNFPEFTGKLCPALCEYSCVLAINDDAVTVRENELSIIEYAFKNKLVKPRIIKKRTGKKVAVIGSGPAGLAAADELNMAGHTVSVFERDQKIGGLLRYGIPDFKIEKKIIDRRVAILKKEGIVFKTSVNAGVDITAKELLKSFDAICLACGNRVPRDIKIEGRNLKNIHFAMDYLTQANKISSGCKISDSEIISANGKKVLIIGGGDTGADCIGTANRQGAACVAQIEVLPRPSEKRTLEFPWPKYPVILKTSSSHQEGGQRLWAVATKKFIGDDKGRVKKAVCAKLDFEQKDSAGLSKMREIAGSEFEIEADLVILAIGFVHAEHKGLVESLNLELDTRGNIKTTDDYKTSVDKIFAAGDARRGQSLIVWAISEGRKAGAAIDKFLSKKIT